MILKKTLFVSYKEFVYSNNAELSDFEFNIADRITPKN